MASDQTEPYADEREALEAACLEGLVETAHGYRYRPALGADAVLRLGYSRTPDTHLAAAAKAEGTLRLAQHLASEVVDGGGWCSLTADDGGRCTEPEVAVRWEDGFADVVCERHAETARERGALVVFPSRHDGTTSAARLREQADPDAEDPGGNIVRRVVNAWDCCGTCAGGVLGSYVSAAKAEALDDLRERLVAAEQQLRELAPTFWESVERERVSGKAQGVQLALSYVDEAIRLREQGGE